MIVGFDEPIIYEPIYEKNQPKIWTNLSEWWLFVSTCFVDLHVFYFIKLGWEVQKIHATVRMLEVMMCFLQNGLGSKKRPVPWKLLLMAPRNLARKPVEVGNLSHYWQGFSTLPGG